MAYRCTFTESLNSHLALKFRCNSGHAIPRADVYRDSYGQWLKINQSSNVARLAATAWQ